MSREGYEGREAMETAFEKAQKTKFERLKSLDSAISAVKKRALPVEAKCPHCSNTQMVNTIKSHNCSFCKRSFVVMPKNKPSRIVNSERNQEKKLSIMLLYSLERKGRYPRWY